MLLCSYGAYRGTLANTSSDDDETGNPIARRYTGFELQYKNDLRMLASDYVAVLTSILGRPRGPSETAQSIFQ